MLYTTDGPRTFVLQSLNIYYLLHWVLTFQHMSRGKSQTMTNKAYLDILIFFILGYFMNFWSQAISPEFLFAYIQCWLCLHLDPCLMCLPRLFALIHWKGSLGTYIFAHEGLDYLQAEQFSFHHQLRNKGATSLPLLKLAIKNGCLQCQTEIHSVHSQNCKARVQAAALTINCTLSFLLALVGLYHLGDVAHKWSKGKLEGSLPFLPNSWWPKFATSILSRNGEQ